ncbi:PQQ repeat protein [Natrialba magadii ATCC 43099]|uniref:PQQ repeat protein n=1 Tax=Natrialba magadii (strain ATCC 43099 / DSM 3394 / CCM 3739 / CIP 104546 / IAM 13178 / JCM 8861 / NBRC 102185 / NCIMB 2190 / MS3) TaxID=547559 RepID=D3SRH0_NATMM|nr:PQQ-binding-like beta-propeller repeat protein [Natrialba magadii]ADD04675.1 PQQ repeat protein [Natrialba magadii ATCC 43099]ELY25331.1 pyrrolo-quinoline quinone [Natrialba magadii ATCC 43099]
MPSTRRSLLASALVGSAALAGCLSRVRSPSPSEPPVAGVDELPDPGNHILGANGSWSSVGCNAANTRVVADGEAPVEGVTERWRIETTQTTYHEPIVADEIIYLFESQQRLRALDTADGDELWTFEDARAPPLVRNGVAYVPSSSAMYALDATTGEQVWDQSFDEPGRVTAPATDAGDELRFGAGETLVALESDTGEELWRRELFGQIHDHAAFYRGYGTVVATEAGMLCVVGDSGTGFRRWQLPAAPMAPPSVDSNTIYVSCRDGMTYALTDDAGHADDIYWSADTGWTERGIAVADGFVFLAGRGSLSALETDTGSAHWEYDIGDWRHTAPAYGRETVFVGGDALYALDPTPGEVLSDGPAVRFRREFGGRVGPGPVLDDGVLYVVAEVDEQEFALLALE